MTPHPNRIVIRTTAGASGSTENSEWLSVMSEANHIARADGEEEIFGAPMTTGAWWLGGYVEHYYDVRLILPVPDTGREYSDGALISSRTERGFLVLKQVVQRLKITTARTMISVQLGKISQY